MAMLIYSYVSLPEGTNLPGLLMAGANRNMTGLTDFPFGRLNQQPDPGIRDVVSKTTHGKL